ncbi:hypothetical protein BDR26DRAFT_930500 [Obelidium mucronatum]|nr:hypothetical protein BDR26DRAFT_930500 [Obelidium mucronatum]
MAATGEEASAASNAFRALVANIGNQVTCIADLKLNTFSGVFAVVRDDNSGGKSKTGDYMLTMVLMDPSTTSTFNVSMFSKQKGHLPPCVKAGQIIKFSGLKIQSFNSKLQGLSNRQSLWKIFDVSSDSAFLNASDLDSQIARFLHMWYTRAAAIDYSAFNNSNKRNICTISKLKDARECFDLYCQVMQVLQQADGTGNMVILVSDFTKANFQNGVTLHESNCPLLYPVAEDALRVTLWDVGQDTRSLVPPSDIQRGSYLYLRNLFTKDGRDANGDTILEASLHSDRAEKSIGGRWQILDLDHLEVVKLRRRVEDQELQINRSSISGLSAASLTLTPAYIKLSRNIKEILDTTCVPTRFKFEARIVDHLPTQLEDFTRLICEYCGHSYLDNVACSKCGNQDTGRIQYMFSFLLGDDEGSFIPVILTGEDADKFLRFEARDLKTDRDALKRLHSALSVLFTVGREGQPRVSDSKKATFCVQSFQPMAPGSSVQFKLIATELIW